MAPSLPQINVARIRSYVFRLPLFTRLILFLIIILWIVSIQSVWDIQTWGALIPKEIGFSTSTTTTTPIDSKQLADIVDLHSVPHKYISFDTCGLLTCILEYLSAHALVGTI